MPRIDLPFEQAQKPDGGQSPQSNLRLLPEPLQELCQKNPHLADYLEYLPIEEVGPPEYHAKLSRKLQDAKRLNVIYPVTDNTFIHIFTSPQHERDYYIPIEPSLLQSLDGIAHKVEGRLLNLVPHLASAETDKQKEEAFLLCLNKICTRNGASPGGKSAKKRFLNNGGDSPISVTPEQFEVLKYLVLRDKMGMGVLAPLIRDPYIEDISCSGVGHIFVEHKVFKSLTCAICFTDFDDLDEFVLRLAERIKRPVTMRKPIVDATLPDGSRVNIVFGREISHRGSNFTIRKFTDVPLSILELIEFGSLTYQMAAYMWMVIEDGMNIFVSGETASGKTTLLNAITTFIPLTHKVVSIEDTPELQVPHQNWLREVTKGGTKDDSGAEVTMFDLLKAALRQRPNVIIIGEIRGVEGNIAFQAMQTGHQAMATFHASAIEKLVQRLTGDPINVPKTYVDNLNVVVIQNAVKLPNGKMGRRAVSINEIVSYDPSTNSYTFVEAFRWDPGDDKFEFVADRNSFILEQKIAPKRGLTAQMKSQIYTELENRAKLLERIHKNRGVTGFYELLQVLAGAKRQGIF